MPTKIQLYSELADSASKQITNSRTNWTDFLDTAARLYKYPYPEQLMIFAQRPDAKACAPIEVWNKPMNRWVKPGSKGIALIDTTGEKPQLKYVFDVADTQDGRNNPRRPFLWQMQPEHESPVIEHLVDSFETDATGDLGGVLYEIAERLAAEYYENNSQDIFYSTEGSYLEDFDELNIEAAYRQALTVSLAYTLLTRCGVPTGDYLADEDFMPVFDFNTPDAITALGTGVSHLSEQVLREIETTIKKQERLKQAERSNDYEKSHLSEPRGISHTSPAPVSPAQSPTWQVRADAPDIPAKPPANTLQFPAAEREAAPTPARDRPDSQPEDGAVTAPITGTEPRPGQNGGRDGVDGSHEQPATPSRGTDIERAGLQLDQTASMDDAGLQNILGQTGLDLLEIDNILRAGGNKNNSDQRIYLQYAHGLLAETIAGFLQKEYQSGGKGFQMGTQKVSVWWDKDGMLIGRGNSALQAEERVFLSWPQVEQRLRHLVTSGQYIAPDRQMEAKETELHRLADSLIFTYRDDMRDICPTPVEWKDNGNVFPEINNRVTGLLMEPDTRSAIIQQFKADNEVLKSHPEERQWHYHNVDKIIAELEEWQRPLVSFNQDAAQPQPGIPFITEDEVDAFLAKGSQYSQGKAQMLQYFLSGHTQKEAADFLKETYGTGGGSHALSGADDSHADYSPKGLVLERGSYTNPYAQVKLNWNAVAKRIDTMINEGRYFSRGEIESFQQQYVPDVVARHIVTFYYDVPDGMLPEGTEKPFPPDLYYSTDQREILLPKVKDAKQLADICAVMEKVALQLDPGMRNYNRKPAALALVQAYRDGTLNLTPRLSSVSIPESVFSTVDAILTQRKEQLQMQLSFFLTEQEQKNRIKTAEAHKPSAVSVSDAEINAILTQALPDISREKLVQVFRTAPRSREAVRLLRETFTGCDFSVPLPSAGTTGLLQSVTGENKLVFTKNTPDGTAQINWSWIQLQQRVTELVSEGVLKTAEQATPLQESTSPYAELKADTPPSVTPEPPTLPQTVYTVGDTVYLENDKPYVISSIDYDIQLMDLSLPSSQLPVHRSESREDFETLLYRNPRNHGITDFLHGDLSDVHPVFSEVLENTLLTGECKTEVGKMLAEGHTNSEIADTLARRFQYQKESCLLTDGTTALYAWHRQGLIVEHPTARRLTQKWEQVAAFCRSQYAQEIGVFQPEAPEQDKHQPEMPLSIQNAAADYQPDYRYINDRLVVFNGVDDDTEAFPQVIARVEPDGEIVFIDPQTPESVKQEIRQVATTELERYKEEAEQRLQQMLEVAEAAAGGKDATPVPASSNTTRPQSRTNFRITDLHLGEGGPKTKFGYNMAAIRTLKQVETENRPATPEEQEILSRYVGWGGIASAFDEHNPKWAAEYTELKKLLTPEEYDKARASTLNAHYTSPTVIKAIYDTVERLGFTSGNVLEPACGIGNFFGMLPESLQGAKLYGVELDSITSRIAKQLYQKADIRTIGFEKTNMPDAFFDMAIGNVPFGNYKVSDTRYDKHNFAIHDYFMAKSLDQVRPGGIVAFVTTSGTLDKRNSSVRKYLAQRAELLGAVRLPNNAFLKNAGTEVTTDIIFLQKRDRALDIEPDWVHLDQTEDGIPVNSYFANHPEMVLGKMVFDESMYGDAKDTACHPIPDADLAKQLAEAMVNIEGEITEPELDDVADQKVTSIDADSSMKNYSYAVFRPSQLGQESKDDRETVYYRENSRMFPVSLPATTLERIKGLVELRDCTQKLIGLQLEDYSDEAIQNEQQHLSYLYDQFTKKYGLINSVGNSRAFSSDSSYFLLCSLEILDEEGKLERKADMFTKRTIKQKKVITSVETASEALAVSIGERACVDLGFMQGLLNRPMDEMLESLQGVIFKIPQEGEPEWVTADEYLSGNVREKLETARRFAEEYPEFAVNVAALEKAQPQDLTASEIAVRLGSTWVKKEYIQQFVHDLLKPPEHLVSRINVNYFDYTGEWNVTAHRSFPSSNVLANVTYGTKRMNAYRIIEDTLNLKDVRVYDTVLDDGKEKRVLNKKETTLAQQKQVAIKQAFQDWIFKDAERRQDVVQTYNRLFNSSRPREYDGSHINFSGISPEIDLRPHQRNAIAHVLYGGNTLLAHEVGAGKTYEMVAAAMESKRLGLCQKSMIAVPNHLTEQIATEFLRLYPAANILVAKSTDFEMKNRKKFCAKIATGDYDAVVIGHTQLEKIPLSKERQERQLQEQIWEITEGLADLRRNDGEHFSIKQLEKTKKSLEARLESLANNQRKDDVVTFEQLGVDRLFVDEAHSFKNLFLYTKMRNVAGISQTEAKKSSDLFGKCRYLDELTGGKGVVFATGTPISNSMTEMYTMQRYLQYETLRELGLTHFDCWASTFGETTTAIELAPEGTGYRARTRFAKFHNLPELMQIFKDVADIKTADMLDLPQPKAVYSTCVVKPSQLQKEMVAELSKRAAVVHAGNIDPSTDNMLKITSDGRKIGLDQRLVDPLLPDDEGSKVNACMSNVHTIWEKTKAEKLTQLVFCDFSTPNADGRFNVYDDIKEKLLKKGIPAEEIAFIHDANTEVRKKELFAKVRQGKVRVLLGSTFKMGSGTNIQDRLVHLHDLDCPWRPSDLQQRAGRIVRQGNLNPEVGITRYVTEGTFDAYLYQTIENKQKFISQIMSSKSPVRSCEDVDESALSYAEIKALCAGNPLIKEKMDLDIEVARLRLLKADHQSQVYQLEDDLLKKYPQAIELAKEQITRFKDDQTRIDTATVPNEDGFSAMELHGKVYQDKKKAGEALLEACKQVKGSEAVNIGSYRGLEMSLGFDTVNKHFNVFLKGGMVYGEIHAGTMLGVTLGTDVFGNITRLNNAIAALPQRLTSVQAHLENLYQQTQNAEVESKKPFPFESELEQKSTRLALLDAELNMEEGKEEKETEQTVMESYVAKRENRSAKRKPSILASLKAAAAGIPPSSDNSKAKDIQI